MTKNEKNMKKKKPVKIYKKKRIKNATKIYLYISNIFVLCSQLLYNARVTRKDENITK